MKTTNRRQAWPLERWEAFGLRCQAVRDRLAKLIGGFPETAGLTPNHINALVRAHDVLFKAMLGAEGVLARQHPEHDAIAAGVIHGEQGNAFFGPCRGRARRDAPALTREQWVEQGREVKAITRRITALLMDLQGAAGATKPHVRRFIRATEAISSAKCKLDSLVYRQHPDWPEFSRVFYGDRDPEIHPKEARS